VCPEVASTIVPLATAAGWIGQACFFSRVLIQWVASERARASVAPRTFWWLSLCGSLLVSGYAIERGQPVMLVSLVIGGAIAVRNLTLRDDRSRRAHRTRAEGLWLLALALVLVAALITAELATSEKILGSSWPWTTIGILGQTLWVARFPLQWWSSERSGSSQFPVSFWWTSLAGNLLLLAYALHLRDTVFVLGFVLGPVIQARNLILARGAKVDRSSRVE
jgi:lipid-A-disaccharide synthase-like uncharacterized protein